VRVRSAHCDDAASWRIEPPGTDEDREADDDLLDELQRDPLPLLRHYADQNRADCVDRLLVLPHDLAEVPVDYPGCKCPSSDERGHDRGRALRDGLYLRWRRRVRLRGLTGY
jgi:hypothetical protein